MANIILNTHFSTEEMNCHCGCGLQVEDNLVIMLEFLRELVGQPLVVTSGARCRSHNAFVNGSIDSNHMKGIAADIACGSSNLRYKILMNAPLVGFTGIGIRGDIIHLDLRPVEDGGGVVFLYS